MNKTEHQVDEVEVRELALALKDLFDVIDEKIGIGDVEIKDCRHIRYARTVYKKIQDSTALNFYGI